MAAKRKKTKIISFSSKNPLKVVNTVKQGKPAGVSIKFANNPLNLILWTTPEKPLNVNTNITVKTQDTIPVCIKLCKPINASSDYAVGIKAFDHIVGTISCNGGSELFNPMDLPKLQQECIDFNQLKPGTVFEKPLFHGEVKCSPLGKEIRASTNGDPPDQVKMAFSNEGIRIAFRQAVSNINITVNNYGEPKLEFLVYSGPSLTGQLAVEVNKEARVINIPQSKVTALEIKGGINEASVVKICYSPAYLDLLYQKEETINRG